MGSTNSHSSVPPRRGPNSRSPTAQGFEARIQEKAAEGRTIQVKTVVTIPTKGQRYEAGKALREKCLRTSHGNVVLGQGEKRDIVSIIESSNEGRLQTLSDNDALAIVRHSRAPSIEH